jgi:AcrR family transcriptional regulator
MAGNDAYHHGNVPEAILGAALEKLEAHQFEALSLRGLAREIGVSPTAVYRHFADKTELIAAIADRGFARLAERFEDVCPFDRTPGSPDEARGELTALGLAYMQFALSAPELFRLMFGREAAAYRRRRTEVTRSGMAWHAGPRINTFRFLEKAMHGLADTGVADRVTPADIGYAWAVVHGYAQLLVGQIELGDPEGLAPDIAARIIASVGPGTVLARE